MLNKKVKIVLCILCALFTISSISCSSNVSPVVNEWKIPTIMFLSGPVAADGAQYKWLVEELAKEINSKGGISGKPFVPVFLDSAFDPSKAAAAMAKAIDMKSVCLIGPLNDMEGKASLPLAVREGIFAFSGTCTEEVAKQFNPWTFNLTNSVETLIKHYMPQWKKKEPKIKHVVTFIEPIFPMLNAIAKGNEKALKKMNVKSTIIEVTPGKVDYSPFVVKAMDSGADAFAFLTTQATTAKLVKDLARRKVPNQRMWIWILGAGEVFFEETKGINEGIYCMSSQTWEYTPKWAELNKKYAASHNGKLLFGMAYVVHDMVYMVKDAIEKQGITGDPAKLEEERIKIRDFAINQKDFEGLQATYDVEKGLAKKIPIYLFQIKKGTTVLVDKIIP